MGLRQKAEAVSIKAYRPPKVPTERPHSPFFDAKDNFQTLLKNLHIEKGGFLVKANEDFYNLCFAADVDITTFHRCMIPSSIIEGFEAKQNNRYSLTNKDLSSIKNFFSSQEYISITNLILYPVEGNRSF
nr:hypothetical protein [Treponema denticola]